MKNAFFSILFLATSVSVYGEPLILAEFKNGSFTSEDFETYISSNYTLSIMNPEDRSDPFLVPERYLKGMALDAVLAGFATDGFLDSERELALRLRDREAQVLSRALFNDYIREMVTPTDPEIRVYYEENIDRYTVPPIFRFRHVFALGLEGSDRRDAARQKIERAMAALKEGMDFVTVAERFSDVRREGREKGEWVRAPMGQLSPAIESLLEKLEPGEISEIVGTPYGFQVFQLGDLSPATPEPFEEVENTIREEIMRPRVETVRLQVMQEAWETIPIQVFPRKTSSDDAGSNEVLFSVGDEVFTVSDFLLLCRALGHNEECLRIISDEGEIREWAETFRYARMARILGLDERERIRKRLDAIRTRTIAEHFLSRQILEQFEYPNMEELEKHYEAHGDRFMSPMLHSGWRIGIKPENADRMTPPDLHFALERTREFLSGLRERALAGEDFSDLARAHSTLSDATGGGWLPLRDSHGALFDLSTENLVGGGISEPVERSKTVYLFKLDERIFPRPLTFEEAQEKVLEDWRQTRRMELEDEWRENMAQEIGLRIDRSALAHWLSVRFSPRTSPRGDSGNSK